jgi:hypothetical protein
MASIGAVAVATALALASAVPAGVGPGAAGPFRGRDSSPILGRGVHSGTNR